MVMCFAKLDDAAGIWLPASAAITIAQDLEQRIHARRLARLAPSGVSRGVACDLRVKCAGLTSRTQGANT